VTQNHEYHCLDGTCIAVRDTRTRAFLKRHVAVGKRITAGIRMKDGGIESISPPESAHPGERVHFADGDEDKHDVLTSTLKAVERPPREIVAAYEGEPE
jgi:hypothetical protein